MIQIIHFRQELPQKFWHIREHIMLLYPIIVDVILDQLKL